MSAQPFLQIQSVSKSFGETEVLRNLNFEIREGEFLSLLGLSGCGKTTLLRIIAGLESLSGGDISLRGKSIVPLSPQERGVAMVFQSYALIPHMTALQNVQYALEGRLFKNLGASERKERAMESLDLVQLGYLADRYPLKMSGGQQQRVALARALALKPSLLLLDEPLSALDALVREHLRSEIRDLHNKTQMTTILVTHDQEEALSLSDRIILMNEGQIAQQGTPEELYHTPENHFAARFVGSSNVLENNESIRFIRPENVAYSFEPRENFIPSSIVSAQFYGPTFRLKVKPSADKTDKDSIASDLLLDISSKGLNLAELSTGRKIYVRP